MLWISTCMSGNRIFQCIVVRGKNEMKTYMRCDGCRLNTYRYETHGSLV